MMDLSSTDFPVPISRECAKHTANDVRTLPADPVKNMLLPALTSLSIAFCSSDSTTAGAGADGAGTGGGSKLSDAGPGGPGLSCGI